MKQWFYFTYALIFIILFSSCSVSKPIIGVTNGDIAPEIALPNSMGDQVILSSLKGSIVLLEFWGSTCSGCKKDHLEISRLSTKYKNTAFEDGLGFKIYSVSNDTNKEAWQKASAEIGIYWSANVCDLKGWESKAMLDYRLNRVPKYYLLDGNGVILAQNIIIADLEKLLLSFIK